MTAELEFDMDLVTPRMMVDFKDKTGTNLLGLFQGNGELAVADLEPEVLTGVIWLALRMGGRPEATWDDALDTPFTVLTQPGGAGADPTSASSSATS